MPPARPTVVRQALRAAGLFLGIGALAPSCYLADQGLSPVGDAMYFPTGLIVSKGRSALYVVNSDFDLQYNGGTVQVLDLTTLRPSLGQLLDGLRSRVGGSAAACGQRFHYRAGDAGFIPGVNSNQILSPGPCLGFPLPHPPSGPLFAGIGAFASGAVLAANPDAGGQRLFVTVRGDPSITWFDVIDDRPTGSPPVNPAPHFGIDCGQSGAESRCGDDHRIGLDPNDNLRFVTLPVEPVGIDISDDTRAIVVANQTQATVSLAENVWVPKQGPRSGEPPQRPVLQFPLGGLSAGPTEVAHVPAPALVRAANGAVGATSPFKPIAYDDGFLVTFNATPELDLFSYHDDALSTPRRPFISRTDAVPITVNADGKDSRGVVIDPTDRHACEDACAGQLACLQACIAIPLQLFLANRSPPSLLIGEIQSKVVLSDQSAAPASNVIDTPVIIRTVALPQGPSKVVLGHVIGLDGLPHTRVFVVCFDTRFIFSYDPVAQRIDATFRTGRGPHSIAFDTGDDGDLTAAGQKRGLHSYLYVGHFTDSYLGVVDLDMRHGDLFGTMFASVGTPVAPRESK